MLHRLRLYAELVKLPHALFALPFALAGALVAARGVPPARPLLFAVLAVFALRTAAMAYNRLADRRFDAANPRTAGRELPRGAARPAEAWALVVAGAAAFVATCAALNRLALQLSPALLLLALGYSLTKRFTALSHVVLGATLAAAPFGGWVAVRGSASGYPFALSLAVLLWVAGFDTLYACQDIAVDRRLGLHSLPARLGEAGALRVARLLHAAAFCAFAAFGLQADLGWPFAWGLAAAALGLAAQHAVVRPGDLSRVQLAFFHANAAVSLTLLVAVWAALLVS